ncbi:hypothetical protein GGI25_003348 [Coemansia spiralis]|uniref:Peptidase C15, pyroglutamyl peptidase I-like protein n=2 Tax=Coemansia TaxID=4863 RepID=A0A9W8G239_9FUNG|nr:hypothetical protein BX070DRAFT_253530 [Coemansia spiralis]KAJ1987091.1 hypothetical protein EDC05_006002 [Coemansia umbellata]KAJ2621665.1 hypothetical protein GGI26_003873 [Coemansia sp. RSA 1358]KAJ2676813.1 hypothetical protein GGI25_003348 [Coemansia spiralis]
MGAKKLKHALLTGFEPFGTPRPMENRSWEVIKQLEGEEIATDKSLVLCHCYELPVSYGPVAELVPKLHQSNDFSIVIHCGAGWPGAVRVEEFAHKCGYTKPGNDGEGDVPTDNQVPGYDTADKLQTTVAVDKLKDELVACGWEKVIVGSDAGHYLCDFTYYISLAEGETTYKQRQRQAPSTLFVHVPPERNDLYSDKELADIIRAIVRHLA